MLSRPCLVLQPPRKVADLPKRTIRCHDHLIEHGLKTPVKELRHRGGVQMSQRRLAHHVHARHIGAGRLSPAQDDSPPKLM